MVNFEVLRMRVCDGCAEEYIPYDPRWPGSTNRFHSKECSALAKGVSQDAAQAKVSAKLKRSGTRKMELTRRKYMKKCKLIVNCLHDAQLECACGKWRFIRTGAVTMEEAEELFKEHCK